ncbi:MAG: hypothetical protein AB1778_10100 [Candidatus Bipolaricaulota bacterium]
MTADMAYEERNTWISGVATFVSYVVYLGIVLLRAKGIPLADVQYVAPLLWTLASSIIASIVGCVVGACLWGKGCGKKDVRDREIERFGGYVGQSFMCMGGSAALILAILEADHFWIANAIYLGCVLSTVLGSITKIVAYRRGLGFC